MRLEHFHDSTPGNLPIQSVANDPDSSPSKQVDCKGQMVLGEEQDNRSRWEAGRPWASLLS